jgi:ATP-binding cassette subfamily B protein
MTSSRKPKVDAELPPTLPAMWRVLKLGYAYEPGLLSSSFTLALLAALPDALLALWFKILADGVTAHDATRIRFGAVALGVSAVATWFLRTVGYRIQRRFRDKIALALEAHVARLQATIPTIAHQERPDCLDRLTMLRNQVFVLDHMYMAVFSMCGWILRLGVTMALLVSIHPALASLVLFAAPAVAVSVWRPTIEQAAQQQSAPFTRLARHLFATATTAAPGKEVRVTGIADQLVRDRRRAWQMGHEPMATARWHSMLWHTLAWAIFGAGYVASIAFVSAVLRAPNGSVLLVLAAGARLSAYIGATVGELGFVRGFWAYGARRLVWLENYAASFAQTGHLPVPTRLSRGIRFDHVSFAYPGTSSLVLDDVTLELPAGAVVAIVGENGAGKSTLIKLLARMYEPTSGNILVDGTELSRIPADAWRTKLAGAFQDFFKFEFRARHSVGVGDLARFDETSAVATAVARAGADDVIAKLGAGLETQLGSTWPDGAEMSFGQWQKLALARAYMRDEPLVLVLDEPTAALDSETEHALFERYADAARASDGRITLLVSHRFSTVRMADLIVVLDRARVAEIGSHDALMDRGGQYAELYGIQAAGYRGSRLPGRREVAPSV